MPIKINTMKMNSFQIDDLRHKLTTSVVKGLQTRFNIKILELHEDGMYHIWNKILKMNVQSLATLNNVINDPKKEVRDINRSLRSLKWVLIKNDDGSYQITSTERKSLRAPTFSVFNKKSGQWSKAADLIAEQNSDYLLFLEHLGVEFNERPHLLSGKNILVYEADKSFSRARTANFLWELEEKMCSSRSGAYPTELTQVSGYKAFLSTNMNDIKQTYLLSSGERLSLAMRTRSAFLLFPILSEKETKSFQLQFSWPFVPDDEIRKYIEIAGKTFGRKNLVMNMGPALGYERAGLNSDFIINMPPLLEPINRVSKEYFTIMNEPGKYNINLGAGHKILDVGCGSGVLAFSAYTASKGRAEIKGVDMDPFAVKVSLKNSGKLGLGDKVPFYIGDLFDSEGIKKEEKFDLIMASLPMNSQQNRFNPLKETLATRFISDLPAHLSENGVALAFLFLDGDLSNHALRNSSLQDFGKSIYEREMEKNGLKYERISGTSFFVSTDSTDMYCIYRICLKNGLNGKKG